MRKRIWLINIRRIKNIKQEEVAQYANISASYYSKIESGERTPAVDIGKKIAEYLNFDWVWLYDEKKRKEAMK